MTLSDINRRIDEAQRLDIVAVVAELNELLGRKTVAYMTGLNSVREIASWLSRETAPRPDREAALRSALQASRYIRDLESDAAARAWFVGTNRFFDFDSPVAILRSESRFPEVVRAARAFVGEALAHLDPKPAVNPKAAEVAEPTPAFERV